jgi:NADH dehydrogenase FAD-containing subunit
MTTYYLGAMFACLLNYNLCTYLIPLSIDCLDQVDKLKIEIKTSARIAGLSPADFDEHSMLKGERTLTIDGTSETIDADLVCWCVGVQPVSSMYPKAWVDENGRVKVDEFLRVKGKEDVFCLGDVCDVKEVKGIYALDTAVAACAVNVKRVGSKGMKKYKPVTTPHSFIAMGRKGGVAQTPFFGGFVMGPWLIKKMKGPDQFAWKSWKLTGAGKKQKWNARLKDSTSKV